MDIAREIQLICSGVYTVVLLLLINAVNDWPNLSRHFESSAQFWQFLLREMWPVPSLLWMVVKFW